MFEVLLEQSAEKDLGRLSNPVHDRIVRSISTLAKNPRPVGCRNLAGRGNDWRIRAGDYRVIYEIINADRIVRVNRIRHRREVYR